MSTHGIEGLFFSEIFVVFPAKDYFSKPLSLIVVQFNFRMTSFFIGFDNSALFHKRHKSVQVVVTFWKAAHINVCIFIIIGLRLKFLTLSRLRG